MLHVRVGTDQTGARGITEMSKMIFFSPGLFWMRCADEVTRQHVRIFSYAAVSFMVHK